VRRISFEKALKADTTRRYDYLDNYVGDLPNIIDLGAIAGGQREDRRGPLGGAGLHYWSAIADRYKLNLEVVNTDVDASFRFVPLDWDAQIRMDPSSPYAMSELIALKDRFDVAMACDTDHDRHGIVASSRACCRPMTICRWRWLPVPPSPGLARRCGRGQDPGVEPDDQSRGQPPGPQAAGNAGGLQVVRRRPV
jgi:phosphoglucomutase